MPKNSLLPTSDQFRTDFPEFANTSVYSDSLIGMYLAQADCLLNQDVFGCQFVAVVELYVAYFAEIRGKVIAAATRNGGSVNTNVGGMLTSKSVDKVSASYDVSGGINPDAGFWNDNWYGRQFYWWWSMSGAGGRQLL
ncbi:DUF4054 domain-containing protein [Citrobacter portucalensis]|uniref:DUF4054 domain-containing protein n=1 Tax=Citrobacter portucalensis TaxID=1639133 RepID=UPI000F8C72A9|nr:DUF4054 domain-containing protein [Citrobacter portucalensis]MEB0790625.1 DUF4054 domain-containing protein [Citrobacter portucalensis]MEB0874293.1 DUF4054 domain-containing protein [Citrobacter portucalensis]RUR35966.1 DUF4054 domain-containing protein [Citrobacter portucalensis]UHD39057.1 DUF4054 domain-containing protein [Citrobacter portucalensis]